MSDRPPERDDLDALLDPLLRFAEDMLKKRSAFFPFGAVMTLDGDIVLAAGYTGSEHPPSLELIATLREGMRSQAANGQIRAAGVCYDTTIRTEGGKAGDAIAVDLEHKAGDAAEILMPYSKPRFGGPKFGAITASAGTRHIFV